MKNKIVKATIFLMMFSLLFSGSQIVANADEEGKVTNGKQMICTFDSYNDYVYTFGFEKAVYTLNKDEDYISEGKASMKAQFENPVGKYDYAPLYTHDKISDIENIEILSCDIYNANDFEVESFFYINNPNGYLDGQSETLAPNSWTTIKFYNNRGRYLITPTSVDTYNWMYSNTYGLPMTIYMDNFYAIKSDAEIVTETKQCAGNEILNFDSLGDLNYVTLGASTSQSMIMPTLFLNTVSTYAKEGNSLGVNVKKMSININGRTDFWTGEVPYASKKVGIDVNRDLAQSIDFSADSGTKGVTVDLYHTHPIDRVFYLTVMDVNARSVSTSITLAPNEWGTLQLESFVGIDAGKISAVSVYVEVYQTFADYEIYIDNLRVLK